MPLLASFLFLIEPTPEPAPAAPPAPVAQAAHEPPAQTQRDPFSPLTNTPRRVGMVLGDDGPRPLLRGPDGHIYVGALLSAQPPAADRDLLDSRLTMLLGQPEP